MSGAKRTPGPWKVASNRGNTAFSSIEDADGYTIANCTDVSVGHWEANARLMAAAPDLLEAAKRYDMANETYDEDNDEAMNEWRAARLAIKAAIAKAEGRA